MGRMVEELILLSKAQRPDFLVCRSIDLAPFTEDLLDKARALGDRHWSLHERGDAQFVGDAHRLTQATMELARNAVKFSAVGSTISIGSRAVPGEVRLWVCDAGVGIRAGELDRVFERFSRASSGVGVEGSGLGLSIVEAIATAHLGRAEVVSEAGVGSTFTIVLPQPDSGPAIRSTAAHRDPRWSAP
jgi:signal transduction histidine kinase